MYRSHSCGELSSSDIGKQVILSGWVQRVRDKGFMIWVDLRDRYGVTQLVVNSQESNSSLLEIFRSLGREFVIQAKGVVIERESKNLKISTGEIEILTTELKVLNKSQVPPFSIEDKTDGGESIRMKYRYLDLRRDYIKNNLIFRHKVTQRVRSFLSDKGFIEVETPCLIKSTPEGARDFVVPSRINPGEFYALPQSPQTFKQLLMVGAMDKYFQIAKCFRDEDLRADRQPEFTQIDCEMSFVHRDDILEIFEELIRYLLRETRGFYVDKFPKITYDYAIENYGNDKPDIRFGMKFAKLNNVSQNKGVTIFDKNELILGIAVPGCSGYSRKQLDSLTNWVKQPQIGASGLIYAKYKGDGSFKSSVDKFFSQEDLKQWAYKTGAKPGDLILVLVGETKRVRTQMSALRMEMAETLGLRKPDEFAPLWVVDFPLLEWDDKSERYRAMHHPFTSPTVQDISSFEGDLLSLRANAYDLVINGNEIGGGSIRIFNKETQQLLFNYLGFTKEEVQRQFGFLLDAFKYGAPPHGGIAFGLDRLVSVLAGKESIRDFIAFPKNNSARDVMIDAPCPISRDQLDELKLNSSGNDEQSKIKN